MIHGKTVLLFVRARGMRPVLTQTILDDPGLPDDSVIGQPSNQFDTPDANFIPPSASRNRMSIRSLRNSVFWSQASSIFDLRIPDHAKVVKVKFSNKLILQSQIFK